MVSMSERFSCFLFLFVLESSYSWLSLPYTFEALALPSINASFFPVFKPLHTQKSTKSCILVISTTASTLPSLPTQSSKIILNSNTRALDLCSAHPPSQLSRFCVTSNLIYPPLRLSRPSSSFPHITLSGCIKRTLLPSPTITPRISYARSRPCYYR